MTGIAHNKSQHFGSLFYETELKTKTKNWPIIGTPCYCMGHRCQCVFVILQDWKSCLSKDDILITSGCLNDCCLSMASDCSDPFVL